MSARLASVDALRGLLVAAMLLVNNPGDWGAVYAPLRHAEWQGCTPADLIFPGFLFILGVSLTLGLRPGAEAALGLRALRVFGLGLALHALSWWALDLPHYRPLGVLQRIALCLGLAGLLALRSGPRGQWLCLGALLLGYAALLCGSGQEPGHNLPGRVDGALLGPLAWRHDPGSGQALEPEGLLSSLGALATTLLGLRAGALLRERRRLALLALGAAAALLGWVLDAWGLRWNKSLWTPSFVLWSGGLAALVLAAAHQALDRRGLPALGVALGRNAIGAYALAWVLAVALDALGLRAVLQQALLGLGLPPAAASLAYALGFVLPFWGLARGLDARRWYWRL